MVQLATTNKRLNGHNDQFENFHIGRVRGRKDRKKINGKSFTVLEDMK